MTNTSAALRRIRASDFPQVGPRLDVSIVMPCLNEAQSLAVCIAAAQEALAELTERRGFAGEVVIADNGSTDGSQALATSLGARVVAVAERGYGAALRGGFSAARGRFLVMGDADGSYDFREAVPMVEALADGASLCMGSRFKGGIKPGAMPWKNRYIGNPVLTGILNLLFQTGIGDAHCGLRALTRDCFERLGLTGDGMEFASEMVIKASLKGETIAEVPATLSPDLRDRPPHLRPWRDGWRHLRYLLMLSPLWLFAIPAAAGAAVSTAILAASLWAFFAIPDQPFFFGNFWTVLAAAVLGVSHISGILAFAGHIYGVRTGYRRSKRWIEALSRFVTLETMLVAGIASGLLGFGILLQVAFSWAARDFGPADSVLPAVLGSLFVTLGAQTMLGGFILAIIGGNEARFLAGERRRSTDAPALPA
jgi:glycosyltransferase involved in cell wall biosynthesis